MGIGQNGIVRPQDGNSTTHIRCPLGVPGYYPTSRFTRGYARAPDQAGRTRILPAITSSSRSYFWPFAQDRLFAMAKPIISMNAQPFTVSWWLYLLYGSENSSMRTPISPM